MPPKKKITQPTIVAQPKSKGKTESQDLSTSGLSAPFTKDVLVLLGLQLDVQSLGRSLRVCSAWKKVLNDESFWKQKCVARWPSMSKLSDVPVQTTGKTKALLVENWRGFEFNVKVDSWRTMFQKCYIRDTCAVSSLRKLLPTKDTYDQEKFRELTTFMQNCASGLNQVDGFFECKQKNPELRFLAETILYSSSSHYEDHDVGRSQSIENDVSGFLLATTGTYVPFKCVHKWTRYYDDAYTQTPFMVKIGSAAFPFTDDEREWVAEYEEDGHQFLDEVRKNLCLKDCQDYEILGFLCSYVIANSSIEDRYEEFFAGWIEQITPQEVKEKEDEERRIKYQSNTSGFTFGTKNDEDEEDNDQGEAMNDEEPEDDEEEEEEKVTRNPKKR